MAKGSSATVSPLLSRRPGTPIPQHLIVAIGAVIVLVPITAFLVANASMQITLIATAAFVLLLIVLWSAEASFYILIFSMLLSPEFIAGDLAGRGTLQRGVTLRFDDYVIAIIALAWLVRLAVFKEASVLRRSPLNAPIFSYIGICALATAAGTFGGRVQPLTGTFFVLKYFEYMVIYFLVVNYARDRRQIERLFWAALITAAIISVIAILQIPSGQRVTAPFEGEGGEPNTLGGYLVLMISLALVFMSEARRPLQYLAWGGFAGLMLLPLVYTYSRTSWLAFCAMLLAITLLCRQKTAFIALVAAGLIFMLISPPQAIIQRASYTLSAARDSITVAGFTIEPSAAARLESWVIAAEEAPEHPLIGWGVTGFGFIDSQYPRAIIETGLLGFLALTWVLWRLYRVGRQLQLEAADTFEWALATGFLAGLAGMIMHGIGANTFIIVRIMEPFWLLAGLVVALLSLHQEPSGPPAQPASASG
ncbi:MAG: O-antigen ligase family protein [Acidobacteriota bacterium]